MRSRMESMITAIMAIGAIFCSMGMSSAPIAHPEAEEAEAIVKAGKPVRGYVFKDDDGHVVSIYLHYYTDEKIQAIDFSVFTKLESITFISGKMTSRSLAHLRKLPKGLKTISFRNSLIDDRELPALLKQLPALFQLTLLGMPISDKTLASIGSHEELSYLDLSGTNTNDGGLRHLANMEKLLALNLSRTKISDAGLREIAKISELRFLSIDNNSVTDAGIEKLAVLENLLTLNVQGTKVTDRGKASLMKLCPELEFR